SWSYAWYDQNWKDAREILLRLVQTVGRGGTYLLNIGPDGKGRVPPQVAKYLEKAGEWIKRYPQVVYGAGPSPWGHALPWGDVTTRSNTLQLVVFDWPADGKLWLPGLQAEISGVGLVGSKPVEPVPWKRHGTWTEFQRSPMFTRTERLASVIEVPFKGTLKVDQTLGVYPNMPANFPVEFAEVSGAEKKRLNWMEKFGEWKFATQAGKWTPAGKAVWTVDVCEPGDYRLELVYRGEGRPVWKIVTDEDVSLQNQQAASTIYHAQPMGLLTFKKPGQHTVTVSLVEGSDKTSLEALRLNPAE
ncbi:MAG: alpha-L-fucosidase, partial [Kiritimatiellaeota bacterium]|nr:alpha-L-fucosidase [Kiritimatiellota bacterium]